MRLPVPSGAGRPTCSTFRLEQGQQPSVVVATEFLELRLLRHSTRLAEWIFATDRSNVLRQLL